jgi:hypothetical protein
MEIYLSTATDEMNYRYISSGRNYCGFVLVFFNQFAVEFDDQHPEGKVHFTEQGRDGEAFLPLNFIAVHCDYFFIQPVINLPENIFRLCAI